MSRSLSRLRRFGRLKAPEPARRYYIAAIAAFLAVGAATAAWAVASPSESGEQVTISAPGFWTLRRLGYDGQHVPVASDMNEVTLRFRLPAKAALAAPRCYEGDPTRRKYACFLIHYHFRIRFREDTRPGFVFASANTNRHYTASQVVFEVKRSESGMTIPWSTLDLVKGYQPHVSTSTEIEVRNVNFLQTEGLRPGENTIGFRVERFRASHDPAGLRQPTLESFEVLEDSGLEWSHRPPGRVGLVVNRSRRRTSRGRTLFVPYRIPLLFGRPLEDVLVRARVSGESIRLKSPSERIIPIVRNVVKGRVAVQATSLGRSRLIISAHSARHRSVATVPVEVLP